MRKVLDILSIYSIDKISKYSLEMSIKSSLRFISNENDFSIYFRIKKKQLISLMGHKEGI